MPPVVPTDVPEPQVTEQPSPRKLSVSSPQSKADKRKSMALKGPRGTTIYGPVNGNCIGDCIGDSFGSSGTT
jgi:hypothetical protein